MVRRWRGFVLWGCLGIGLLAGSVGVLAQSSMRARTHFALVVYSMPDQSSDIVGVLPPGSEIVVEARSTDAVWVLGHDIGGNPRGWAESRFLEYAPEANVPDLPVSQETVYVPPDTDSGRSYSSINLNDYPIIPVRWGRAREIYEQGQALGADAHVVAKIGDCISDNRHFLSPFGWKQYHLGDHAYLQGVIDHFSLSLAYDSLAAYDGLVTSAALDPIFANPLACLPGESPLRCEYRVHNPSMAVIMFGAQDLLFTPLDQFDRNLRQIVHESIQAGVIPILSTFPGNIEMWERAVIYNQVVVRVALDYDIPLMNLWRALEALPNHGLNEDGRHLSSPVTDSGDLRGPNLQRGYPLRNLVTLQALDAVWRGVMY